MTMMSSLKALLFAAPAQDAMTAGNAAASGPAPDGVFAALLGDMTQAAPGAPVTGDVLPVPATPIASMPATLVPAASNAVAPKPLDGPAGPDAQSGAPLSAGAPVEGASSAPSMEPSTLVADSPVAPPAVKPLPGKQKQTAEAGPLPLPLPSASGQADPVAPDAVAEPEGDADGDGTSPTPTADNGLPVKAAPLAAGLAPAPIPVPSPVSVDGPARSAARAMGAQSTAALRPERQDAPAALPDAMPVATIAPDGRAALPAHVDTPALARTGKDDGVTPAPLTLPPAFIVAPRGVPGAGQSETGGADAVVPAAIPSSGSKPVVAPLAQDAVPVVAESAPVQPGGLVPALAATSFPDAPVPTPVIAPLIPAVRSDAAAPVPPTATLAQMAQAVAAVVLPVPAAARDAPPVPGTGIGPDATPPPAMAAISPAPAPTPAPARSEALSLLQLVRDHFVGRDKAAAVPDNPATAGRTPDTADSLLQTGSAPTVPVIAPQPGPTPLAPVAPMLTTAPVDLGGTLATQVVDMGVSGQWIDGLAREIASLSARGAQGRFQIDSGQLGPVQVDIRPGATGASVSLTVATDAAQQALQADGDRLIADAALSSVRIADLRIDRAPVAEAARADNGGQQSGSNQQNPSQNQGQQSQSPVGQGPSQNLSQGAGQNRTPNRDNFAGNHKAADESAVLSQADSRDAGGDGAGRPAGRARYA